MLATTEERFVYINPSVVCFSTHYYHRSKLLLASHHALADRMHHLPTIRKYSRTTSRATELDFAMTRIPSSSDTVQRALQHRTTLNGSTVECCSSVATAVDKIERMRTNAKSQSGLGPAR